ncbi:MAG: HU family DNA-binding protein [Propionibacteriaceae bacterium]|jgi:DNA-binding protein HU-beta
MNKGELIAAIAERYYFGNKSEAERALKAVTDTIAAETARVGRVAISGFGIFEKLHREARTVRNPKTGARKDATAKDYVRFRIGTRFETKLTPEK